MFRVKASEIHARIPMIGGDCACDAAGGLHSERRRRLSGSRGVPLAGCLAGQLQAGIARQTSRSLHQSIGTRIIVRTTALAVLVLCTVATLVAPATPVRRSGGRLHQIKLFAREILASMDQGVITTDLRNNDHQHQFGRDPDPGSGLGLCRSPLADRPAEGLPLVELADQVAERNTAIWDQDFTQAQRWPPAVASARTRTFSRTPLAVRLAACCCFAT